MIIQYLILWTKYGKDLNYRTTSNTFGEKPSPRERCTLTKINDDKLILFGGYECSEDETVEINYQDTYILNLIKMEWEKMNLIGKIPDARYFIIKDHVTLLEAINKDFIYLEE
jgi:hypothetical protein